MAQISKPSWLAASVALTAAQLATVRRFDPAIGEVPRSQAYDWPASTIVLALVPSAEPNNSTEKSGSYIAPFDFQIGEIAIGAQTAGATTLTGDILVGDTVASAATILDAPQDLKTGVPEPSVIRPEVDSDTVSAGQAIYAQFIAGSAVACAGCAAYVTLKRL